jgi:hypothetical protein
MSGTSLERDDSNFEHIPGIKSMLTEEGINAPVEEADNAPIYKKLHGSRIPVSKHLGKLWQGRIGAGRSSRSRWEDSWDASVAAYSAEQSDHRNPRDGTSGNKRTARRKGESHSQTENVIFSAIKAIIPAIYARNPTAEFTATDDSDEAQKAWVQALEKLCDTLSSLKQAPGINLKYKVKQAIVAAKLMNLAWIETGYTIKEDSSDAALAELERMSQELEQADSTKRIQEIEGQIVALEEAVNTLAPSGPYTRYYSAKDLLVDPEAMEPDFADAKWMAACDYLPTAYLNAVYGTKEADNSNVKSIYEPTAVLTATTSSFNKEVHDNSSFKLFDTNEAAHYGYDDYKSYIAAQRTKCWRIYDKVTRRIFLFADNKWDWPIWVEDDKLELPSFFPFQPLIFNVSPMGPYAFSEVAYVMDQQDAINEINDAERRARMDLQYRVLFDQGSGVTRDAVERVLKGSGPVAEPIKVPDGKKIDDMFFSPQPNILKAPQLFDVARQRQVIDGILGVTPSLRASEYKTNTTNKAIEQYNATTSSRLDEQIDEIEEFVGRIFYDVAYVCARFMSQEEVANLLGQQYGQVWRRVEDPTELKRMFTMRVVGGSTTKPTSQFKQQIAVQIGQVLGQFAQAAPGSITKIVLKLFEQAYDEVGISQEDWDHLNAEVDAKLGIQAKAAEPPPPSGSNGQPSAGGPPNGGGSPPAAQLIQAIEAMPPEAKIALGNAMAKGVPMAQALQQIMQLVQQQGPSPTQ